jgi:peptide chain release factor 1
LSFSLDDVDIVTTKGSGPGGQHRNKVESAVIVTHIPTGITVKIESSRSQYQNKQTALGILSSRITEIAKSDQKHSERIVRRKLAGSGERGDKIRTYREQEDRILDHRSGNTWRLSKWLKGEW